MWIGGKKRLATWAGSCRVVVVSDGKLFLINTHVLESVDERFPVSAILYEVDDDDVVMIKCKVK